MVSLSFIIPTSSANSCSLNLLLRSLQRQTWKDFEVIVVSNVRQIELPMAMSNVRMLFTPTPRGASAARNFAASFASGKIFAFVDDDVELDSNWGKSAVSSFSEARTGVVSGQAVVPLERYGYGYFPHPLLWVVGGTYWKEGHIRSIAGAAGMSLCIRRESFFRVGGYNESLGPIGDRPERQRWQRLGAEESDLVLRVRRLGQNIIYNPQMLVTHKLRRETLMPVGLARRASHVGHNRAYIHSQYGAEGTSGDLELLHSIVTVTISSMVALPRHPRTSWKKLAVTSIVLFFFALGLAKGYADFGFASRTAA
jgi:Glycosyl transferase family 2